MASVFLVEPHDHIKIAIKRAISGSKYEVTEEHDTGDSALLAFKNAKNKPDLVVMDILFPTGRGGIQIMEEMLRIDAKTRTVLIFDKKSAVRQVEGSKKGAAGHIRYPFSSPDKVLTELAKAEGSQQSRGVVAMGSEDHFAHLENRMSLEIKKKGLFSFLSGSASGVSESLSVNQIKFTTDKAFKTGDLLSVNVRLGKANEALDVKVQKAKDKGGSFEIVGAIELAKSERERLRKLIVKIATKA